MSIADNVNAFYQENYEIAPNYLRNFLCPSFSIHIQHMSISCIYFYSYVSACKLNFYDKESWTQFVKSNVYDMDTWTHFVQFDLKEF